MTQKKSVILIFLLANSSLLLSFSNLEQRLQQDTTFFK